MCIIKFLEAVKKIKEYYETIKADFIKTLSGTKAECTLPFDYDVLERIVRCVFPDIVKYYEEKRKPEVSVPVMLFYPIIRMLKIYSPIKEE